jgi:hypothetical protein
MTELSAEGRSESERGTNAAAASVIAARRGWRLPHGTGRVPRWAVPIAILAVALMGVSAVVEITGAAKAQTEVWSALTLNFGSNPVTDSLNVTFARVPYISQPTQWTSAGFGNASLTGNGAYLTNSTDYGTNYGIAQFNSSASATSAYASWNVSKYLGTNVSYLFSDARVALNGTGTTFNLVLSESAVASEPVTTGSVAAGSATSAQQAIWVTATYYDGEYNLTAYDWEYSAGNDVVTAHALGSAARQAPIQFFEVYVYAQPLQTVVSIVNTTDGAVFASTSAIHPVFDGNLTKLNYVSEVLSAAASSTDSAMVLDSQYLVDHNTYSNSPTAAITERGLAPMVVGDLSTRADAPFDPGAIQPSLVSPPSASSSYSNTRVSLGAFQSVVNSSSVPSETSALLNASDIVSPTSDNFTMNAAQSLTTIRAESEDQSDSPTATLYTTSWSQTSVEGQIHSFLSGYIAGQTGLPSADVFLPAPPLVSDIAVWQQFSSQAVSTVHDYLTSAIPGFLQSNDLALVNSTTGAIDAGADIGEFMGASGQVYAAQVHVSASGFASVYDPVNGVTYASAEAAGFPAGSSITPGASAIFVPGQATFLGWSASGLPEWSAGGCFIVCLPSVSGAASAVSNFLGSASKTVSNAVGSVTSTVSNDVIKPVSGSTASALSGFTSDLSKAVNTVMPFVGGTLANVGSSVSGTITHTLGGVSGALGSVTSSTAGAIASGVSSLSNDVYHIGAAAGSALSKVPGALAQGVGVVENTVGKAVSTAGAVLYDGMASTANVLVNGGKAALGDIGSALDTVGTAIVKTQGAVLSAVENAFGTVGSAILTAIEAPFKLLGSALGSIFSWPTALSSSVGMILEYVAIGIVAIVIVVLVLWLVMRRRKHGKSRAVGGEARGGHRGRRTHRHTARTAEAWSEPNSQVRVSYRLPGAA